MYPKSPPNRDFRVMGERLLIETRRRHCGKVFYVCRRCWRGQIYCGAVCRQIRQRQSRRAAQRRYRQTERGREIRRLAERRRRMRKRKKPVGDEGTTPPLTRSNRRSPCPVNEVRCCRNDNPKLTPSDSPILTPLCLGCTPGWGGGGQRRQGMEGARWATGVPCPC
jgi:hypothetical protein